MGNDSQESLEALTKYFGFSAFRKGQGEVVKAILEGFDAVVVMPTGSGKSLCYQLPALLRPGVTVVISPLIALMKDQVDALCSRDIPATLINSSIPLELQNERINRLRRAEYKLIYIAPERFRSTNFVDALSTVRISLFAVDEAHCISSWGHDFRPDYLRLRGAIEKLGHPQTVALTATATPHVRSDIIEQLGLRQPRAFVSGFDRPNLAINVVHTSTDREKVSRLKRLAGSTNGSGIVYASTRKAVEKVASRLSDAGLKVAAYHAGMDESVRERAQNEFLGGGVQIIVATNAFGMGIDKADIRFVTHYHLPGSIEAYYQEIGRAGRDELPATCELLFNYADKQTQDFFIEGSYPVPDVINRIYDVLTKTGEKRIELSTAEIAARAGLRNEMAVQSSLNILEKAGHLERGNAAVNQAALRLLVAPQIARERMGAGDVRAKQVLFSLLADGGISQKFQRDYSLPELAKTIQMDIPSVRRALALLAGVGLITYKPSRRSSSILMLDDPPVKQLRIQPREIARRAALEQRKLREVISFCYAETCYRAFILDYFGDTDYHATCGSCGNCRKNTKTGTKVGTSGSRGASPLVKGTTVLDKFTRDQTPTGLELDHELSEQTRIRRIRERSEELTIEDTGFDSGARGPARPLSDDERLVTRKVLACAARMRGRFGKNMLASTLRGSRSKGVLQAGLETLSTHGILAGTAQDEIMGYIDALLDAGCLASSKGAYPTISITDLGMEVMRDEKAIELSLPEHDEARQRPEKSTAESPTLDHTYALYLDGLTIEEISLLRRLSEVTIEGHLADCIMQGRDIDVSRFVSNEERALVEAAISKLGTERLRPLKDALPEQISYRTIRLIVAEARRREMSAETI